MLVTTILGVTLFFLLVSILSMIGRINLLMRKMDTINEFFISTDQSMDSEALLSVKDKLSGEHQNKHQ